MSSLRALAEFATLSTAAARPSAPPLGSERPGHSFLVKKNFSLTREGTSARLKTRDTRGPALPSPTPGSTACSNSSCIYICTLHVARRTLHVGCTLRMCMCMSMCIHMRACAEWWCRHLAAAPHRHHVPRKEREDMSPAVAAAIAAGAAAGAAANRTEREAAGLTDCDHTGVI